MYNLIWNVKHNRYLPLTFTRFFSIVLTQEAQVMPDTLKLHLSYSSILLEALYRTIPPIGSTLTTGLFGLLVDVLVPGAVSSFPGLSAVTICTSIIRALKTLIDNIT